jgi:septum formation protein
MSSPVLPIILGSRSPRRHELLLTLVNPERVEVVPPRSSEEAGFDGLSTLDAIRQQLRSIARAKCDDVLDQLSKRNSRFLAVITADTVIVGFEEDGLPVVLGQPPESDDWQTTVRDWFTRYYFDREHLAVTAVCIDTPCGQAAHRVIESNVVFDGNAKKWLDWYLSTGEPLGKAGGYGIQGAGGVFVSRVEGSIANVVGLPLNAVLETFAELGVDIGGCCA